MSFNPLLQREGLTRRRTGARWHPEGAMFESIQGVIASESAAVGFNEEETLSSGEARRWQEERIWRRLPKIIGKRSI